MSPALESFWQSQQREFLAAGYIGVDYRLARLDIVHCNNLTRFTTRTT